MAPAIGALTLSLADDFGRERGGESSLCLKGIGDEQLLKHAYFLALLCMASCGGKSGKEFSRSEAQPIPPSNFASGVTPPALPASIDSDYLTYERQLLAIQQVYGDRPVALNSGALWYKSLSYPSSAVTAKDAEVFSVADAMEHGVGYGTFYNVDASRTLIFQTFWAPQKPASGGVYVLEMQDGIPISLSATKIPGGTRVHVINNQDGSVSIILPGVDEGELISGEPGDAPSYTYNLADGTWADINILSGAHGSITFDYENDGDDDVFLQSWGGEFDFSAMVIKNEGGAFTPIKIPHQSDVAGLMSLAPFYDDSGRLGLVFTDAVSVAEKWAIPNERTVIAYFPADLAGPAEEVVELPIPYFEREEFEGIRQNIPDWEGTVGLSHDVSAKVIDLDHDGDLDIVIGSMVWSDENPYGVIQLLINSNGEFEDQTDERLFNWSLAGNTAHQMDFLDINDDGFVDILISDHGNAFNKIPALQNNSIGGGSRVLVNDGTGHFAVIAHHQIHETKSFGATFVPSISKYDGKLRFTRMDSLPSSPPSRSISVEEIEFAYVYSTGPNGIDPAEYGEPDFNEFFYLLKNQVVQDALNSGTYQSGLEHYLKEGKAMGLKSYARE